MPNFTIVILVVHFVKWNSMVFVGDATVHTNGFQSSSALVILFGNTLRIIKMIAVFEGEKLQTYNSPS